MTANLLDTAEAALLPRDGLAALAPVRCHPDVTVTAVGPSVWVRWPAGDAAVWQCLLPVAGAEFFTRHNGRWHRIGRRLPAFDVPPPGEGRPLDRVLFPAPLPSAAVPAPAAAPMPLRLVPSTAARPATAARCRLMSLAAWADRATTAELASVHGAVSSGRALLRGGRLPWLPECERFWGERVLVPLGFRPEPDLPESVLRAACGIGGGELMLLDAAGAEAVPARALGPLTRAGVRLALRQLTGGG
jgi:hypothetical protein